MSQLITLEKKATLDSRVAKLITFTRLTQTIAENKDFQIRTIHELPLLQCVVLRKSYFS